MKNTMFKKTRRTDSGMISAEYAVGTIATMSIAGILVWLASQDWFRDLIANVFKLIISFMF